MSNVRAALVRSREASHHHMDSCERAGLRWSEEPVTEILLSNAHPDIQIAAFNRWEEARTGADWLWWWLGPNGEAYGMLVQAKRLYAKGTRWSYKFDHNEGAQREALWSSAESLDVVPAYALYLGTQEYRAPAPCAREVHSDTNCDACKVLAVALMPAILADPTFVVDAGSTYDRSVALERIVDLAEQRSSWLGAIDAQLSDDLRTFLTTGQTGVRSVARSLVDRVLTVRGRQMSKGVETMVRTEHLGPVFSDLPGDRGHFTEAYMPVMLRGLVNAPPDYVMSMVAGDPPGPPPAENVAGVVLIRLNGSEGL